MLAIIGGLALCLAALFFMYTDAVSRATEALLDRVEVALAKRELRRAPRREGDRVGVTVFTHS
ncbi:MAG TPA: hypothetical protein VD968_03355 [Pyrinomonadaceae bacterium]|nr:hypothetical protein [Pyrinomonadaceae bacterium]